MFKVNKKNQNNFIDVAMVFLFVKFKRISHLFFFFFIADFEQVNVSLVSIVRETFQWLDSGHEVAHK